MSRKTYVYTILLCLLLAALSTMFAGCSSEHGATAAPLETVSNVSVAVAQETRVPDWLRVVGTVQPDQTSQISSQMMGNIVEIRAHEGDLVKRGQILAVLDDAQPRAAMQQAEATVSAAQNGVTAADSELALAAATLKRYQQLYEKKSVSPQEFDQINARYQSAQAQRAIAQAQQSQANAALAQARTAFGYTIIRAPFSGIVTQKMADAGMLASPGMPLFAMEDTRNYRLEVSVDESDIHLVRIGQTVPATIDALENPALSGKVVQIVPAADPTSRSFLVKIELPADSRLRSGLFGRANFLRGEREALLIPRTSILERGNLQGIYVLGADQIAELRYVTLGQTNGPDVEVLSGLQAGESFVAAPGGRELGGKRIAAQP
jgi:RND family efflux transporter MFP subunit